MELLKLPKTTAKIIAETNPIIGSGRSFSVAIGGQPFQLQSTLRTDIERTITVHLTAGGASCWLSTTELDAFAKLNEVLGGTQLGLLPTDLQPAVLEAAFEELLQTLGQLTTKKWTVKDVTTRQPENLQEIGLILSDRRGTAWQGVLAYGDEFAPTLAALWRRGNATQELAVDAIPLVAGIEIGSTHLEVSELESLEIGDVILIEHAHEGEDETKANVAGAICVIGTLVEDQLVVGSVRTTPPASTPDEPLQTEVAVQVTFERGRVVLTPMQLLTLNPGDSLPVSPSLDGRIKVIASGKTIGHGELVQLGVHRGVRFDRAHPNDANSLAVFPTSWISK